MTGWAGFRTAFWLVASGLVPLATSAAEWVRPGINGAGPNVWGIQGGLRFAIPPGGITGPNEGPRGLIRVGYPVRQNGAYDIINFIAVEPVVNGFKGFSELEHSALDGVQGKRIWTDNPIEPGNLWNPEPGVEQLDVTINVEEFFNGAHAYLVVSQRSDAPDEIRLTIHSRPGSAAMDYCILTATMGNRVRARDLWLNNETVSSLDLYPDYTGNAFTDHTYFGVDRLRRTAAGGVMAAITNDEPEGTIIWPWPAAPNWNYRGAKVTQYWKKTAGTFNDDLHVAVNARYTYWASNDPIPGGISYENFEFRESYFEGQSFVFGITRKHPGEIGFTPATAVAHYRFEEGEAGAVADRAFDSSGHNRDLRVVHGQPVYSSDVPVSTILPEETNVLAMDFGSGQLGFAGNADEGLSLVEFDDFTVEAWIRMNDLEGWQAAVSRRNFGGRRGLGPEPLFELAKSGLDHRFHLKAVRLDGSTLEVSGGPVAEADRWYHVAAVGDVAAGTVALYVNRKLAGIADGYTGLYRPGNGMPWALGRSSWNNDPVHWLNGAVDEVRISDQALESTQFLAEFSIAGQPQDVMAWAGEDATFSATVTGNPVGFQWEVSADDGASWSEIAGANAVSHTLGDVSLADDRHRLRLVVTDGTGAMEVTDAALLRVGDPETAPLPTDVAAHYRFDEGSFGGIATGAIDSSGNGRHLSSVLGTPRYSAPAPGYGFPRMGLDEPLALNFAAGENAIQGTDGDLLSQVVWDDFTFEAWVKFDRVDAFQQILGRDDRHNQNDDAHSLFRMENALDARFRAVATGRQGQLIHLNSEYFFTPNEWTHVAIVGDKSAGTMRAYANGRLVGTADNFDGLFIPQPSTHWTIGRGQWGGFHYDFVEGQIDEVRLSQAALSPVEFLNFHQAIVHFAEHPANVSVAGGEEAVFRALAGGGGSAELTYRWEVSSDGGLTWWQASGTAVTSAAGSELATVPQNGHQYRVVASRGEESAISHVATAHAIPAIDAWRQVYFGTTDPAGEAGLAADPDGDGLNNFLEYGLGLDPTVAENPGEAVRFAVTGNSLSLTFTHVADPTLIYEIEASDDLLDWIVVKEYPPFTTSGSKEYIEPLNGAQQRFLRLSLTFLE